MKFTQLQLFLLLLTTLFIGILFCHGMNTVEALTNNNNSKKETKGVSKSQIPEGDEDLYILKSEIVPPVCPACPTQAACPRQKPCPPCPPCARCPEPPFECKKVPNYRSSTVDCLPKHWLADCSQF